MFGGEVVLCVQFVYDLVEGFRCIQLSGGHSLFQTKGELCNLRERLLHSCLLVCYPLAASRQLDALGDILLRPEKQRIVAFMVRQP